MRRSAAVGIVGLATCGALALGAQLTASPYPEVDAVAELVPGESLTVRATFPNDDGTTGMRFDRHFRGLRVYGEQVIVRVEADGTTITVISLPEIKLDSVTSTAPSISASAAERTVARARTSPHPVSMQSELLVYGMEPPARLAWEVTTSTEFGGIVSPDTATAVDAHTGEIIAEWPLNINATS